MGDPVRKKLWVLSGEASGDIYGAMLVRRMMAEAKERGCELTVSGMGGPEMRKTGMEIMVDSTELGVIGIFEVLRHIGTFLGIFFRLVARARKERPDAVILIDYPGFNLRFAKAMHRSGIKVIWYISPQIWVWGKHRKPVLAKVCRKMLVIFPFEPEVYAGTGLDVDFVGHPLLDVVKERTDLSIVRDPNCFVLLPGSRRMEVTRLLRPMLDCVAELHKKHPKLYFVIAAPRERIAAMCRTILDEYRSAHPELPEIELVCGRTAYYQQKAGTGLAASGTVTVESAIAGLPLVVCYKLNWLTILVGLVLVKLYRGRFTMVNIIADKVVFEEFLQYHAEKKEMLPAIERILPGGERRTQVENDMDELRRMLASPRASDATQQAAEDCFRVLRESDGE